MFSPHGFCGRTKHVKRPQQLALIKPAATLEHVSRFHRRRPFFIGNKSWRFISHVHPGSLRPLHPQYGCGSHSRQAAGRGHGAAGVLQPRLAHLQRMVLPRSRLHHTRAVRNGRSRRLFRWGLDLSGSSLLLSQLFLSNVVIKNKQTNRKYVLLGKQTKDRNVMLDGFLWASRRSLELSRSRQLFGCWIRMSCGGSAWRHSGNVEVEHDKRVKIRCSVLLGNENDKNNSS